MAVKVGIMPEYTSYTVALGEKIDLKIYDQNGMEINHNLLKFTPNDSRILHHSSGTIEGHQIGGSSVVVSDKDGNSTNIFIRVIPSNSNYNTASLPIFMTQDDREQCYNMNIYTCHSFMDGLISNESVNNMDIDETRIRLYARQTALFELPGMNRNFAVLAAFAGIRNIYDLSQVDNSKAISVFKIVAPMARMFECSQDIFEYPSEELISSIIDEAHEYREFSSKYARFVYMDPEPTYVLGTQGVKLKTDTDVIYEALQFLKNIAISLPLPRTISGRVVMRKKNESLKDAEPQRGYKVTISGIANPACDKAEDDDDLHAFTDNNGAFVIVMPEKYNMQETIKFTISYHDCNNGSSVTTYEEGINAVKSTTFIKRASEIMKAMRIEYYTWVSDEPDNSECSTGKWEYKSIPAIELLEKLDRLKESNDKAKQIEDEIYALIDKEKVEQQLINLKSSVINKFKELYDELSYHLYKKENERDEIKEENNRQLYKYNKEIKNYLKKLVTGLQNEKKLVKQKLTQDDKVLAVENKKLINDIEHKLDIINTLNHTCNAEDVKLLRYLFKNGKYYELDGIIEESGTNVTRLEMVDFVKKDDSLNSLVLYYVDIFESYTQKIDIISREINELEALVKYAEVELAKYNDDFSASDVYEENDCLKQVENEHQLSCGSINMRDKFEEGLRKLYDGTFEDCKIFRSKYDAYINDELQLKTKERQFEELKKIIESNQIEDSFNQYLLEHEADQLVIDYKKARKNANEYYLEIQDMNDTIGVQNKVQLGLTKNEIEYKDTTDESSLQAAINSILSKSLNAEFSAPFELIEENFIGQGSKPRALPTVRLMGEGKSEVELPTDTAPARVFNFSIMQRLVEPVVTKNGVEIERKKIVNPIDVMNYKEGLYNAEENIPIASSLGIGYILKMHQAWIPDGFALGNLLYSMVLAPGEEQRVVVREHSEHYTIGDEASALDTIRDEYANDQIDHETAAFEQAALRASDASSSYSYSAQASSVGASVSGGYGPIAASVSASHSKNSGKGSSSAAQNDSYDEVSSAAQDFQTAIKTQSDRLATAKRLSVRAADSTELESVSSKIVANHNHSHVMTVQYWEVTRRYKMETCIEGIDLIIFVPMKPISFLPDKSRADVTELEVYNSFSNLNLSIDKFSDFTKDLFNYRYYSLLRYADTLERFLPKRYLGGLELIKKYSSYPKWIACENTSETSLLQLKLTGYFLEFDDISATLHFNNSNETVNGELEISDFITIDPSMNTRKDVIYAIKKIRTGYRVSKQIDVPTTVKTPKGNFTYRTAIDKYDIEKIQDIPTLIYTFYLPSYLSKDDISHITIQNNVSGYDFSLSQSPEYLEDYEYAAIQNYEHKKYNFAEDDDSSSKDLRRIAHYSKSLPECYTNPIQSFSRSELLSFGGIKITASITKGQEFTDNLVSMDSVKSEEKIKFTETFENEKISSSKLYSLPIKIDVSSHIPYLGQDQIMKIEDTFRHVATNTMKYSVAVWNSLNEMERTMMLEQYTVDLNYGKIAENYSSDGDEVNIPLLNCINVKKPLGFYGNSMLFPFTYPQELAEKLGKTAGDIQDELYRYHTTNFRVPSTSISVPTNGMIGEAVLGRTNVSEKIDLTRFWNWKDSDIDHIELNQNAINGHSLLDNADTRWVDAPTQGVVATEHIGNSGLLNSLTSRPQPTFADVLANTDIRELMKNADNIASAGREQVVKSTADMTKSAISAASDIAKAVASKGNSVQQMVGDKDNITSALKKMGLSDNVANNLANKIASGDSSFSDILTSISNAGGKSNDISEQTEDAAPIGTNENQEDTKEPIDLSNDEFSEIINYAIEAIDEGISPVDMFNKWMKEKKNSEISYSEADIKKIAEEYCIKNGTTMEEVLNIINELTK